jgi:hypothetical protein
LGAGLGGAATVIFAGLWIVWRKRRSTHQRVAGRKSFHKAELDGSPEGRKQTRPLPAELKGHFEGYQLPADGEKSPVELP